MKASSVSLSILTATLFAIPALAQTNPAVAATATAPTADNANWEQRRQEIIKRYDQNGDGKLDEAEKAAAHAEIRRAGGAGAGQFGPTGRWRKELVKRFDKDADGMLNEAERAEAMKAVARFQARRTEIIKRFDKDGDGVLNEAERAEAKKARDEFWRQQKGS